MLFIPSINGFADELDVSAYEVQLNKESKIVYANGNVQITDDKKNIIFTEKAEYNKINEVVRSFGETDIVTSEKFRIQGEDIFYDNIKQVIYSNKKNLVYREQSMNYKELEHHALLKKRNIGFHIFYLILQLSNSLNQLN